MADHQHQLQQKEMNIVVADCLNLPIGFWFHPSDYEIVNDYLMKKVLDEEFTCAAIAEVNLNKTEPWDLPKLAKMGEKEWYFFYQKECKYSTGLRANRAMKAGYWKAMGKDKEVYKHSEGKGVLVGMKKMLVFYEGRAPRGDKTNWVMHEYRLEGNDGLPNPAFASNSTANAFMTMKASTSTSKGEWVVCHVLDKTNRIKKTIAPAHQVAITNIEIDHNQNNITSIPMPKPLQLPLPAPVPMQFPILTELAMDPVAPYYPNTSTGMPHMAGIGGANGLQINGALFSNLIGVVPPQMNLYHHMGIGATVGQMGMGAVGQMGMGAVGVFDIAAVESRLSSMVSRKEEQANAAEISSMMSMAGFGSATTTIEIDGIRK